MTLAPVLVYTLAVCTGISVLAIFILAVKLRGRNDTGPVSSLDEIQTELRKLNSLFTVPHIRGGIGEVLLEELLRTWLADSMFAVQYSFQDGSRADAVIFLGDYIVAVDAKFPVESVKEAFETGEDVPPSAETKRALCKHMESIGTKYIRPEEGTLQFALMYIPSEKIYYHFFVDPKQNLYAEALRYNVVPVSPSSMFLYVQTVAYGLRGMTLPKAQQDLAQIAYQMQKNLQEFIKIHNVLGTHIKNIMKSYEEGIRRLSKLEQSMEKLDGSGT